ncbi:MAG TPA: hypothetical protein ENJ18_03275 [Nannocystis exedens]|nr:hypothetical protein [Nannocystis exedens]
MPVDASRPDQVIIQRQIPASALLVVASAPNLATTVEVYTPGHGALAGNVSPHFAGPLARWPSAAREATATLVRRTSEHLMNPETGLDLEIVIDDAARPWLVQARPLTRDLQPGFADFRRIVWADGHTLPSGWWRLDTAHNPAPLSPAHASLLSWLGRHRAGTPRTLAGWLYESVDPIVPVHEATPQKNTLPPLGPDPFAAIDYLRAEALPKARDRLDAIIDRLRDADPQICRATIDRAREATLAMLDIYAALAPARAGPRTPPPTEDVPLCLVDRQRFLDVLPCAWDIASPSLREELSERSDEHPSEKSGEKSGEKLTKCRSATRPDPAAPADPADQSALSAPDAPDGRSFPADPSAPPQTPSTVNAAIWLLRELDDHLFALGLAPLRRVYLRAAQLLSLGEREVFLLDQEALAAALDRALTGSELEQTLATQRRRLQLASLLRPPPHLFNRAPLPIPTYGRFRGLGLGPQFQGPVAVRRDLADLLARPPKAGAVLVMPTLTVAAAIVLDRLNIRALCTASGGALSHAALLVRELAISAIIGCSGATELCEGEIIDLKPAQGRLRRNTSIPEGQTRRHRH